MRVHARRAFARPAILREVDESPAIPSQSRPGLIDTLASRWRRDLLFFAIAASIIAVDQFTKWLVRSNLSLYEEWDVTFGPIRIIHVVNSGAAFGILQGQTPFLIVMSLFGLGAILLYYLYPPMDHGLIRVALGMQLGGAIGNLIDRVRLGEVTDFIDVGEFPTFNVADSSITVSIIAILGFFLLQEVEAARQRPAPGTTGDDSQRQPTADE